MTIDVTMLTAEQIAVLAGCFTLLAAATSAIASFVVASVNARYARSLARESARRNYYREVLEPYFKNLETQYALYEEVAEIFSHNISRQNGSIVEPISAFDSDVRRFTEIRSLLSSPYTFLTQLPPAILVIVKSNSVLESTVSRYEQMLNSVYQTVKASNGSQPPNGFTEENFKERIDSLRQRTIDARLAYEYFVFQ